MARQFLGAPERVSRVDVKVDIELEPRALDVHRLTNGMKLIYCFPQNGWRSDQARAAEYLRVSGTYTVERFEIGGWITYLWLEEVPGVAFNSVVFAEAG